MKRRDPQLKQWEAALALLFQVDVGHSELREAVEGSENPEDGAGPAEEAVQLAARALGNRRRVDRILRGHLQHYELERVPAVERNLLRLAISELLRQPEAPDPACVPRAAAVADTFGGAESPRFVTGVLKTIVEEMLAGGPASRGEAPPRPPVPTSGSAPTDQVSPGAGEAAPRSDESSQRSSRRNPRSPFRGSTAAPRRSPSDTSRRAPGEADRSGPGRSSGTRSGEYRRSPGPPTGEGSRRPGRSARDSRDRPSSAAGDVRGPRPPPGRAAGSGDDRSRPPRGGSGRVRVSRMVQEGGVVPATDPDGGQSPGC